MCVAALLFTSCATTAPQLFTELPTVVSPSVDKVTSAPGDCPETLPMMAGDVASCRGLLVPFVDAQYSSDVEGILLPTYVELYAHERTWRLLDRDLAQTSYAALWSHSRATDRQADGLRVAVVAVAVVGLLAGCAIGLAADDLAAVVP